MSLDLSAVVQQISDMVTLLKTGRNAQLTKISNAVNILRQQPANLDSFKKKIRLSKTTWLVAEPLEKLDNVYPLPATPTEFCLLATDGSHIDVDRHHSTYCYLINISSISLQYGSKPDAAIQSEPKLYSEDADLKIVSPDGFREIPIEGNLLGMKRSVEECRKLAELASSVPENSETLALLDGTLILWNLEAYPEFVSQELLDKEFLSHLETIKELNQKRRMALASYISYPRSVDVVNALRVALCPRELVDSDKCSTCRTRECYALSTIHDRELFSHLLKPGERSALFISPSRIQKRYGHHLVHFFYVKLENEVARLEIPLWVARDEKLLNLTHSLIIDQCQRGQGYPVALSEAHEKAVITVSDRENFWHLLDNSMMNVHLPATDSAKSQSKRTKYL